METIQVTISEGEKSKYGIKKHILSFNELKIAISNQMAKENLKQSIELAAKYGLDKMTMEEINDEVKAVRENAKNHN